MGQLFLVDFMVAKLWLLNFHEFLAFIVMHVAVIEIETCIFISQNAEKHKK
jgi:hypothetical protein